jgi:hypothetical protein
MQRAVTTTIEEEVFSVWFPYIHCWATDVFYGFVSRLYKLSSRKSEVSRRAKAFRTFIRIYSLLKSEHLTANIKLILHKALIRSVMTRLFRLGISG